MSLQVSLHAPERVPCVRALTLADLPRPVCRHASVLSPGTVRTNERVSCAGPCVLDAHTHRLEGDRPPQDPEHGGRDQESVPGRVRDYRNRARRHTRHPRGVTDLLDVSGMLICGGKGTGKLSFKKVVLAGGFKARKSRIEVDVSFNVGRYICLPRLVVCMDGARMLACPCCKLPPVMPPPSLRSFTGRGRGGGLASAPRHAFDAVPAARQRT